MFDDEIQIGVYLKVGKQTLGLRNLQRKNF